MAERMQMAEIEEAAKGDGGGGTAGDRASAVNVAEEVEADGEEPEKQQQARRILERIEREEEEDQEAKEAKLLQEAMTTVPEMDDEGNDDSPPVDSNQLQGMSLSELKKHRKLLKKGLKGSASTP